jgi:regulator of replication initiation timing
MKYFQDLIYRRQKIKELKAEISELKKANRSLSKSNNFFRQKIKKIKPYLHQIKKRDAENEKTLEVVSNMFAKFFVSVRQNRVDNEIAVKYIEKTLRGIL